jgi:membrane protease YdiL (CAAX protease family)
MKDLFKNKKLATYILTVLIVFQVVLLFAQFFVLGNRAKPAVGRDNSSIFPFIFFFIFIPSILLSKNNNLSEKKKRLLVWGLVVLAAIVLSLMVLVLVKAW